MKTMMIITAFLIGSLLNLQAGEQEYAIGKKVSFKSDVLNETREILIYTPETYHLSNQRYPVLYVLDGAAHFHHVSGIVQFLAGNGKIPEMIVVAVQNVDRTRDFSPTHVDGKPTSGGAEKFLKFINEELIPTVEKKYKAMSFRILAGHSLGGEFAAYALLEAPELFNAYIAISPYMMYDNGFILDEARAKIKTVYDNPVYFYMTIGDEPEYFQTLDEFQKIIKKVNPSGLEFKYEKYSGENHGTVPHLSIYNGLSFIFSDWQLTPETFVAGVPAIDKHYKMISEKYGYEISTPEYTLNALGYYYLNKDEMDNALAVFSENIDRFPESANVYDSYGEALEIDNKYEMAEVNYANAVRIAKKENHPNIDIYTKNLERIKGKLAFK